MKARSTLVIIAALSLLLPACDSSQDGPPAAAGISTAPASTSTDAHAPVLSSAAGLLRGVPAGTASCGSPIEISFEWNIGTAISTESVQLWVGDSQNAKLFAAGGAIGKATTGPWAAPGSVFVLRNGNDGTEIDRLVIPGDACPPESRK